MKKPTKLSINQLINEKKFKIIIYVTICVILYFIIRKWFFIGLFIIINFLSFYIPQMIGVSSPIETISFSAVVTGFAYGPFEALLVVSASWYNLAVTGHLTVENSVTNIIVTVLALIVPIFKIYPVALIGILFITIRYIIQFCFEYFIFNRSRAIRKIPKRIINFLFWALVFMRFGQEFLQLMKL